MHFDLSVRYSTDRKMLESYFRIKENFRDIAGVVRSYILLVPGYILWTPTNESR
ncbi:MAG: hypothetical protein KBG33_02870 [Paludibacteraceae bacterium]|nr:hypothetical protein [Paludibacteraceae bacterium]HOR39579.1 hypothetical protein [Paludibacteraceae bacterium]